MIIQFKQRIETGLHCRFCKCSGQFESLWETSPIKGIVCNDCKRQLRYYVAELI